MVRQFLKDTYLLVDGAFVEPRERIECEDGFSLSVQASRFNYCTPRENLADGNYTSVEVGFPNAEEPELNAFIEGKGNPCKAIYPYVPIEVIDKIIKKHGGIVAR